MKIETIPPLPAEPTTAIPGTPEKKAVLQARFNAGTQLFHPADARFAGDTRPHVWLFLRGSSPMRSGTGLKPGGNLIRSKYFGLRPPRESKFFKSRKP